MSVSGKSDLDLFGLLSLLPLRASWNSSRGEYCWNLSPDGRSASARLPFGSAGLSISDEGQDRAVKRVRLSINLRQSVQLHSLDLRYATSFGPPDRAWVPHLRPGRNFVIADQVFRSPSIVVTKGTESIALVPDLSEWPGLTSSFLDFVVDGPDRNAMISHGLGSYRTTGHVFFKRTESKEAIPAGSELSISHFLLHCQGSDDLPLGRVNSFIWEQFRRRSGHLPQVLALSQYERHICGRIFSPDIYHEFDHQGRRVAGMITQTFTSRRKPKVMGPKAVRKYVANQDWFVRGLRLIQSRIFPNRIGNRVLTWVLHSGMVAIVPMAWFQAWLNQARNAVAAALHARRIDDPELERKAGLIIELALSAPVEHGYFPAVCFFPQGDVFWVRGSRAFAVIDSYHLPDAAVTGFHLLEWHEMIRPDQRIMDRCKGLARFLIGMQDSSGAIPAWVKPSDKGFAVEGQLARSACTAGPAMFLARLNRVSPDAETLEAARAALEFIGREVLPEDKWFDFELFYSCAGRPTGEEGPDPYTGCYPMNTLCMYWAARACLDVYLQTRDDKLLMLGRKALDRLSAFQQAHDHPRISIDTYGGFGVMNADAEFNDARQGLFAPLYLDYYMATGEPELFERGVAALRACFTTMLVEDHAEVAPGNLVHFRPSDRGSILENYGHIGRDVVTAGYLSPDWGCATALYGSGLVFRDFGQVFLDVRNKRAFGIDMCEAGIKSLRDGVISIDVLGRVQGRLDVVLHDPGRLVERMLFNGSPAEPLDNESKRFIVQR